jgi:hypothetical protein
LLVPHVPSQTFEEAAQHVAGSLGSEHRHAPAHLQQRALHLLGKALVLKVLEPKVLYQLVAIAVASQYLRKQVSLLGDMCLANERRDHAGHMQALLPVEARRQRICDALEQIAKVHLARKCAGQAINGRAFGHCISLRN